MKRTLAVLLAVIMLFALGATAFAAEENAEEEADQVQNQEWDESVPTEITEEIQKLFDEAMKGLLGVNYQPIAVLGQKDDVYCILCKATVVYPGAKPYNTLVYIKGTAEKAEIQNIYELWIDAHSENRADEVQIDYGTSELYSEDEMDEAIAAICEEFDSWEGCELHSLQYAGDDCSTKENIDWLNSLGDGHDFTECMEFVSEFHSPAEGGGAWEPDEEYTGWQWWLGRSEGGSWELVSWGY